MCTPFFCTEGKMPEESLELGRGLGVLWKSLLCNHPHCTLLCNLQNASTHNDPGPCQQGSEVDRQVGFFGGRGCIPPQIPQFII
jgi:hypothetical protein